VVPSSASTTTEGTAAGGRGQGGVDAGGERRAAACGKVGAGPGYLDASGRAERHVGTVASEGDQSDTVPALVGVEQEVEDGALNRLHAGLGAHRARGADGENDQDPGPLLPNSPRVRRRRRRTGPGRALLAGRRRPGSWAPPPRVSEPAWPRPARRPPRAEVGHLPLPSPYEPDLRQLMEPPATRWCDPRCRRPDATASTSRPGCGWTSGRSRANGRPTSSNSRRTAPGAPGCAE